MDQVTLVPQPSGPLAGFRVLEIGQYIAVPGAAQILAEQGAEVIKVEPPGGEATRHLPGFGAAMFTAYNRGKRMVEVDLATQEGQRQVRSLVLDCDVVLANLRPGSLDRLGLGADDLCALRPELVHLSVTGFGAGGSMRDRPGLDIAAQAESGIMWVTGEAEGEPQRVGFPVVDAAATFAVAQLVATALLGRSRSGKGAKIALSLWDVALQLQATNWAGYAMTGEEPVRKGNGQANAAPAADLVRVRDGWVVVSAYTPRHWDRLCAVIGLPELADDPRFATSLERVRHRSEMHEHLDQAFANMSRQEVVSMLSTAGLVCGAVRDLPESKAVRDAEPATPFRTTEHTRSDDPPWQLGPLADWWSGDPARDLSVPRPAGADNDLLSDVTLDTGSRS